MLCLWMAKTLCAGENPAAAQQSGAISGQIHEFHLQIIILSVALSFVAER